jgi:hypothetical protein
VILVKEDLGKIGALLVGLAVIQNFGFVAKIQLLKNYYVARLEVTTDLQEEGMQ